MSQLEELINTQPAVNPPRVTLYGTHGIGKTTFGTSTTEPIFILTEDGLGTLTVPHFDLATTFPQVINSLNLLAEEQHSYRTVVLDSVDWLEKLIFADICNVRDVKAIGDLDWGKGYQQAVTYWDTLFTVLNKLRFQKRMAVVLLAHQQIKRYDSPDNDGYDRYTLDLHKGGASLVYEWSDCVWFANYQTFVTQSDAGFNKKVNKGVGQGDRLVYTSERPAYIAKSRYVVPHELTLENAWQVLLQTLKGE